MSDIRHRHETHAIARRRPHEVHHCGVLSALQFAGFRLSEHVYKNALEIELRAAGHRVDREVRVVVYYKGEPIAVQIIDIIVDGKVVVEVKASAEIRPAW